MADVDANVSGTTAEETNTDNQPTIDDLLERVAKAESIVKKVNAENERYKNANDILSKQIAERKREDRSNKSEIEQKLEELEEKLAASEESNRLLMSENKRNKALSAYKDLSEDTVESLIEAAGIDADHSAIASIFEKEMKRVAQQAEANWQKNRSGANSGVGTGVQEKTVPEKLVERRNTASTSNSDILAHYTKK